MFRRFAFAGFALLCAFAPAAHATSTVTMQDREQAACYNDVQTLCGDLVPDVDKVSACMLSNRAKVSAACVKFFPPVGSAG